MLEQLMNPGSGKNGTGIVHLMKSIIFEQR